MTDLRLEEYFPTPRMNRLVNSQGGSRDPDPGLATKCWKNSKYFVCRTCSRDVLVPLFITIFLFFIQNWSGFIVVIMNTVHIFKESNIEINEFQATILVGCVQVLGNY